MTGRGDMYADVTAQVLAALDAGTVPWRMPWSPAGHMNPLTNVHQSAAYIANWRRRLADDPRCVVIAAQRAQHAADLILGPGELAA